MELIARSPRLVAALASAALVAGVAPAMGAPAGAEDSYVVRAVDGALAAAEAAVIGVGGRVLRRLVTLDTLTVRLSASAARRLAGVAGVTAVTPNGAIVLAGASSSAVGSSYDPSVDPYSLLNDEAAIGARQLWQTATGAGIDVALVDSGVTAVTGLDATDKVIVGPDLSFDSQSAQTRNLDGYGHGTHLAGIIAGHDAGVLPGSGAPTSAFLGVAPDARIVSVKVADARGVSDISQVIAGIDWVVQHAHVNGLNIRVLNLSFGTDSDQPYLTDPLAHAAEVAWRHGIVVVAAAGNAGQSLGHLETPATDPYLISVGASDGMGTPTRRDDDVTDFSSRGDGTRNPDLVAPGAHVQSLRVPGSYVDQHFGAFALNDRFQRGSGTSQATAAVAGAAALLLQHYPTLTPDDVKKLLMQTAYPLAGPAVAAQGAGLVNLRSAFTAEPPAAHQTWPQAKGTGSLEAARGSAHVTAGGIVLDGEQDIFGVAYDAAVMSAATEAGSTWDGGNWNGSGWAGSGWVSSSWASSSWASSSWASSSWASSSWASSSWASSSWAATGWASSVWE